MFSVLTFPGLREEPERTIYGTRTCHGLLCAHLWLPMVPVASVSKREEPTHTQYLYIWTIVIAIIFYISAPLPFLHVPLRIEKLKRNLGDLKLLCHPADPSLF